MPDVHVMPHGDGWALMDFDEILVSDAGERQIFSRREDAIRAARALAADEGSRVVLHGEDGDVAADDVPGPGYDAAEQ